MLINLVDKYLIVKNNKPFGMRITQIKNINYCSNSKIEQIDPSLNVIL